MSKYRITLEGKTYEMEVELMDGNHAPQAQPRNSQPVQKNPAAEQKTEAAPQKKAQDGNDGAVAAPMPGTVIRIEKEQGAAVKAGETVLILEAMKMENEIVAPKDGTVISMNCSAGGTVAGGEILFEIG
jgi:biotin carboxyl carrier protein